MYVRVRRTCFFSTTEDISTFLTHYWTRRKTFVNPLEPISPHYYSELENNDVEQFSFKMNEDYESYKCKGLRVILHTFSDNIQSEVKTLTTYSDLYQTLM